MSPRPPFPPLSPAKSGKQRVIIGMLLGTVLLGGGVSYVVSGDKAPKRAIKRQEVVTITLPPPPPPPPPPPKVEPPPQEEKPEEETMEELVEEEPVDLTPPDDAPPEAPPSEDLGTGITGGNGPDMGLTSGGGGGRTGGGRGGLGGKNPYARYSVSAIGTIENALRNDPVTGKAVINGLNLEFWPDANGTITRARVIGSSAGSAMDQAVKRVVVGLRTQPAANASGMPASVKIRIKARKPGN